MRKTNVSKFLFVSIAVALLVWAVGFLLIGDRESLRAKADQGATTEATAAAAGARILPTDSKLKIEPK